MLARWGSIFNALAWSSLLLSSTFECGAQQAGSSQNVTIANNSSQIDYSPFLCNISGDASFDPECDGGWQILNVDGTSVVSTQGASSQGANITPQMFLQFRASALYLTTSSLSNATVNITVSAGNVVVSTPANSSAGVIDILNLPESETTTLSLTFISGSLPSRLDIGTITIQVYDNSSTSSFLPTPTLPPTVILPTTITPTTSLPSSTTLPSALPSATSTSNASNSRRQLIAYAVGLTLGLGLVLPLIGTVGFFVWKRRRRRTQEPTVHEAELGSTSRPTRPTRRFWRRDKDNQDTRWFN